MKALTLVDHAIRAVCCGEAKPGCGWPDTACTDIRTGPCVAPDNAMIAFRLLYPKEPPKEWLNAMAKGLFDDPHSTVSWVSWDREVPEDEQRCWRDDALRCYRAHPLWQALWGC